MSYNRANPSPRYQALMAQYRTLHADGDRLNDLAPDKTFDGRSLPPHVNAIKMMIDRHRVTSLLDYGCGKAEAYNRIIGRMEDGREVKGLKAIWGLKEVALYDPGYEPYSKLPEGSFDAVISTDVLEHCPEEDIEWIVGEIFAYSRKTVFCTVATYPAVKKLPTGENAHITIKSAGWWLDHFERAKKAHERRPYFLVIARSGKDFLLVEG
jgi:hypothetical protein